MVTVLDPQPIIAHESVLQLVASTISKSGITEEARLHASQVILQVLLRGAKRKQYCLLMRAGHNGFQAVQPFRVLTPLIAAASSTHNPTAVRACLAATLIITSGTLVLRQHVCSVLQNTPLNLCWTRHFLRVPHLLYAMLRVNAGWWVMVVCRQCWWSG